MTLDRGTRFEIEPEPTPEEREAILAAVARVQAERDRAPGNWWDQGVHENLSGDEEE